jgi:hypothetical protein
MWFDIGVARLLLVLCIIALGLACGKRSRLWLAALSPLLLLAALAPGYDPFTMLLALVVLGACFALGSYWGPRLHSAASTQRQGGTP